MDKETKNILILLGGGIATFGILILLDKLTKKEKEIILPGYRIGKEIKESDITKKFYSELEKLEEEFKNKGIVFENIPGNLFKRNPRDEAHKAIIRRIKKEYPDFGSKVESIISELKKYARDKYKGEWTVYIFEWKRKPTTQFLYYLNRVANIPAFGFHTVGLAVDIVPFNNIHKRWSWDLKNNAVNDLFNKLGELARKHGLVWGGDWKTFKDYPHIQVGGTILNIKDASVYMPLIEMNDTIKSQVG